jgi:hypothetical protein
MVVEEIIRAIKLIAGLLIPNAAIPSAGLFFAQFVRMLLVNARRQREGLPSCVN